MDEKCFPGLKHREFQQKQSKFGALFNEDGTYAAPVVENFVFFNEADFFSQKLLLNKCDKINKELNSDLDKYEQFVRMKGRRPNYDIYACFQPFNEAFKAFFPLLKSIKKQIKKGDIILNLWDRTAWSAALLAGLFPEQKVINLWEGNKDILGYRGFNFWHQSNDNPVQIAFANLDQGLPFADNSIGLAFGLDTFHRFNQSTLLKELYRVVDPNGAILFPHVHLSNNEPDPFFERGCRQLHGLDYHHYFQQFETSSHRKGYVFPEPEMFLLNELSDEKDRAIVSDPNSKHYNATIAILPSEWEKTEKLVPFRFDDIENPQDCRILINPLLDIDLHQNKITLNNDKLEGRVGYLLERHPVYLKKLVDTYSISNNESKILYWANRLHTLTQIAAITGIELNTIIESLRKMQAADILQIVPVDENHLRLQQFVSTQAYILPKEKQTINALWQRASRMFADNVFIYSELDDSELTYEECNELIELIMLTLQNQGIGKGDKIAIISPNHFEAILSIIAALRLGVVVVPIDYELAQPIIEHILDEIDPKLIFSDHHHAAYLKQSNHALVQFDEEEDLMQLLPFSDWLSDEDSSELKQELIYSDSLACILYTSGSTGLPKGVMHTHGHLVRSGRLITETFHWQSNSRFFTPGELDSMSGFRNQVVAPLEVGASIIIPNHDHKAHLFSLVEIMETYQATILGTTPVLLGQLLQYEKRVKTSLQSLQTIMCTGSNLSPKLKQHFYEKFNLVALNYYGLTETTGICLSEDPENYQLDQNTIGIPRGCIAQVVDDNGEPVDKGEKGFLRIYSDNIMQAYYKNDVQTNDMVKDGWLYTGDIARWQENGHLELHGRTRDIIKIASGQLVFASEVENCLLGCKEIVAAVAVGAISSQESEKIIAFISLHENINKDQKEVQQQLTLHLNEHLGVRKTPSQWVFMDQLPVSANGKILKSELLNNFNKQ